MGAGAVLKEKLKESAASVLPITLIVAALSFTLVPVPAGLMLAFLIGAALLVAGMGLFTLGVEQSMTPLGNRVGAAITKSRRLGVMLAVSFALGVAVTISEPDLQVLAETVPHISNGVLIGTVGVGVGLLLAVCMLRILLGISLRWVLLGLYALVFALAAFADSGFLSVAFDAGGVTTGPMTVPFIMALGVGVSNIRSDKNAEADSFGLVAISSVGPILAVLLLGFFYRGGGTAAAAEPAVPADTVTLGLAYLTALPDYLAETALALLPIALALLLFQLVVFRMPRHRFYKMCVGLGYTYAGLVLFLTGVNAGFSPLGTVLGAGLAARWSGAALIPAAMVMGWFIITAEPAVAVLEKQVEEITSGAISARVIRFGLSAAVAAAMGLAMIRVLTGLPILWFLVPGYAIALALSFFVPRIFTAIAFDSGGVASGPMTAAFMLPLAMGASAELGGNPLTDAFGLVAMVAMMPLITIQILGAVYSLRRKREEKAAEQYGDTDIIELWR